VDEYTNAIFKAVQKKFVKVEKTQGRNQAQALVHHDTRDYGPGMTWYGNLEQTRLFTKFPHTHNKKERPVSHNRRPPVHWLK